MALCAAVAGDWMPSQFRCHLLPLTVRHQLVPHNKSSKLRGQSQGPSCRTVRQLPGSGGLGSGSALVQACCHVFYWSPAEGQWPPGHALLKPDPLRARQWGRTQDAIEVPSWNVTLWLHPQPMVNEVRRPPQGPWEEIHSTLSSRRFCVGVHGMTKCVATLL
jgi:hypothetical protein